MDTSRYPGPTVFQAHSTIYKTTFDQPRVMVANNLPHKSVDATIFIIMGAPKGHDNCFAISKSYLISFSALASNRMFEAVK